MKISLISLEGPDEQRLSLEEAREQLMQTPEEFAVTIRYLWGEDKAAPLFFPEAVDRWLNLAAALRRRLAQRSDETAILNTRADFDVATGGASEITFMRGRPVITYRSLLNALLLESSFASGGPLLPRECEAPGCSRWFTPRNHAGEYCSASCRRSAQNARAYRRRRARELLNKGLAIDDVADQLNMNLGEIKELLDHEKEDS